MTGTQAIRYGGIADLTLKGMLTPTLTTSCPPRPAPR